MHIMFMQVLQSVRTGITCEGRNTLGVCLNDLSEDLPFSPDPTRKMLRKTTCGPKNNASKDFLPFGSRSKGHASISAQLCGWMTYHRKYKGGDYKRYLKVTIINTD
jgi:hypothetical protein